MRVVDRFHGVVDGAVNGREAGTDARTLVASDESGEIVVWDVGRGAVRERFAG